MKKMFVNFLLLSAILLSGYSQLFAHVTGKSTSDKILQETFLSTNSNHGVINHRYESYVVKPFLTHIDRFNCDIEITDSEDDETSSLKKYFKASPYFAKSTASPQVDYIIEFIQQASFLKKFSHLLSCKRYILLRVIRI